MNIIKINISLIFCLLIGQITYSQVNSKYKSDRIFYSIAYYDIFEKNIPANQLDIYLKATESFSDKKMMREIIIRKLLNENKNEEYSTITPLKNKISELEKVAFLDSLPKFRKNKIDNLIPLIYFYYLFELNDLSENIFFPYDLVGLISASKNNVPVFYKLFIEEETDFEENYIGCLHEFIFWMEYAMENHGEFSFFRNFAFDKINDIQHANNILTSDAILDSIFLQILNKYPALPFYLDLRLVSNCMDEMDNNPSAIPSIEYVKSNSKKFIESTYLKLLKRKPHPNETKYLLSWIKKSRNFTPKMLYYIIMTSEEYMYY